MKRISFILLAVLALLIACETDEDAYNVQGFQAVKKYVDEAIPLTDDMIEQTKAASFDELADTIIAVEEVNENLYQFNEDDSYNETEMAEWEIELGLEKGEWELKGKELRKSLASLKKEQENFMTRFEELQTNNELTEENLLTALEDLEASRASLGEQMRK